MRKLLGVVVANDVGLEALEMDVSFPRNKALKDHANTYDF